MGDLKREAAEIEASVEIVVRCQQCGDVMPIAKPRLEYDHSIRSFYKIDAYCDCIAQPIDNLCEQIRQRKKENIGHEGLVEQLICLLQKNDDYFKEAFK